MLSTLGDSPLLSDERPRITRRKIEHVAFFAIGNVDPVEPSGQLLDEPHFHLRMEGTQETFPYLASLAGKVMAERRAATLPNFSDLIGYRSASPNCWPTMC